MSDTYTGTHAIFRALVSVVHLESVGAHDLSASFEDLGVSAEQLAKGTTAVAKMQTVYRLPPVSSSGDLHPFYWQLGSETVNAAEFNGVAGGVELLAVLAEIRSAL